MKENPFIIKGYKSKKFFCDRIAETQALLSNIANGVDTTLISPRKYGKTGLILHLFDQIRKKSLPYHTLYVDIYSTLSLEDFVKELSSSILETFPEKTSAGKKFLNFLKSLRPVFSYDGLSGSPQVSFAYSSENDKVSTLKDLLNYLNTQDKPIVLAIDEFQQIAQYPEKNIEALLRTIIQNLHNIIFIYCGSKRNLMSEMFHSANRPFFSSTSTLSIDKIDRDNYFGFIKEKFNENGLSISSEAIDFVLDWTMLHTFYTQCLCNHLFRRQKNITIEDVKTSCKDILNGESANYAQFREFLTQQQWKMLIAIAKEEFLTQPTSAKFLSKYNLGGATNARRMLDALVEKELVLKETAKDRTSYRVYDVFLLRYLALEY